MRESREISQINASDGLTTLITTEYPVFPTTRKISRLVEAVAILISIVTQHTATRGEACHWILGRFAPYESSSLATDRNDGSRSCHISGDSMPTGHGPGKVELIPSLPSGWGR